MWSKKQVKIAFLLFFIGITGIIFGIYNTKNSDSNVVSVTSTAQSREETDIINEDTEKKRDLDNSKPQNSESKDSDSSNEETSLEETGNMDSNQVDSAKRIYVYVCGEVNSPGVYDFSKESRIVDAIERAGGMKKDAAGEYINQALLLTDGQRVYVPSKDDVKKNNFEIDANGNVVNQDDSLNTDNKTSNIQSKSSKAKDDTSTSTSKSTSSKTKVNINKASKEELTSLPGIGETRAEKIIEYRQSNGNFKSIDEIMNVTGIKEGLYSKISDYITI